MCRICHEGETRVDGQSERLASPCACRGSIQHVHESCLRRWHGSDPSCHQSAWKCDVCRERFTWEFDANNREHSSVFAYLKRKFSQDWPFLEKLLLNILKKSNLVQVSTMIYVVYIHRIGKTLLVDLVPAHLHAAALEASLQSSLLWWHHGPLQLLCGVAISVVILIPLVRLSIAVSRPISVSLFQVSSDRQSRPGRTQRGIWREKR